MKVILCVFIGVLLACLVLFLVIRYKLKRALGPQYDDLKNALSEIPKLAKQEYSSVKSIGGMTNIIKPKIVVPIHYGIIVGTKEDAIKFKSLINKNIECEIMY